MKTNIQFETNAIIKSRFNNKKQKLDLLIVQVISNAMPSLPLNKKNFSIPSNIFLADPVFYESAPIDILIGAEFAYSFLCTGQLPIKGHAAVLQKTILGWIVAGRVYGNKSTVKARPIQSICNFVKNQDLPILWELDAVQTVSTFSQEEQACENQDHIKRDESGRYVVKLPFTEKTKQLGDSRNTGLQRFYALERKFEKNPALKEKYSECINSYLEEGHMDEVLDKESLNQGYYLPHHAVIKETNVTTKTRILLQLAKDESHSYPSASAILERDFYVDDLLTGAQSFQESFDLRNDLIQLLNKGGFNFRKWGSNDPRLTNDLPSNLTNTYISLDPKDY